MAKRRTEKEIIQDENQEWLRNMLKNGLTRVEARRRMEKWGTWRKFDAARKEIQAKKQESGEQKKTPDAG